MKRFVALLLLFFCNIALMFAEYGSRGRMSDLPEEDYGNPIGDFLTIVFGVIALIVVIIYVIAKIYGKYKEEIPGCLGAVIASIIFLGGALLLGAIMRGCNGSSKQNNTYEQHVTPSPSSSSSYPNSQYQTKPSYQSPPSYQTNTTEESTYQTKKCGHCNGSGKITCTYCAGKGSISTKCDNCGGTGKRTCSTCSGSGFVPDYSGQGFATTKCGSCNGRGYTKCEFCEGTGRGSEIQCPECDGKGVKDCPYCNGSGTE